MATQGKTPTFETFEIAAWSADKVDPGYKSFTKQIQKVVGDKEIIVFTPISKPGSLSIKFLVITRKWS